MDLSCLIVSAFFSCRFMEIDLGEIRKDVQCPICLGTQFCPEYFSLGTELLLKLESRYFLQSA